MRTDVHSLPKKKPDIGQEYIDVTFASVQEAAKEFLSCTAGKILIVSDGFAMRRLANVSTAPRAVTVVFDGDALPLFAMPDGIGAVIAAGNAPVLRAARYYAELHAVPCLLFPASCALDGVFEERGEVCIDGKKAVVPLKAGEVVCSLPDMAPSYSSAYGRMLLARLALFEGKMLSRFGLRKLTSAHDKAGALLCGGGELTAETLVRRNAQLRILEREGLETGEGLAAAALAGGEIAAYRTLCTLYAAFFRYGKPRKYFVPDYRTRAALAECAYTSVAVPSPEEYSRRAIALERMRSEAHRELQLLMREDGTHFRAIRALGGTVAESAPAEALKTLPEICPHGLTAVMRDFGLMEFEKRV